MDQETTTAAARKRDYFSALYDVALSINSTLDPQEVLGSLAESAAKALEAKGASIMLLSPDRKELNHSRAYGLSDWYVRKGPLRVDESMSQSLAGKVVTIPEMRTDPRVQYRTQAIEEGISSIVSVPVRLRGEVIGLVRLYSEIPREFREDEIRFLEAVANLGAVALDNAKRFSETKHSLEDARQDLLDWYAAWGIEWSADTLASKATPERDAA